MGVVTPDLAGYIERQDYLRATLGGPVTFRIPVTATWPEGTKLNPITGEPYDATAKRTDGGYTDVVKTCLIIKKEASPLRPQSDTQVTAAGDLSGMDLIIDISSADYEDVEAASDLICEGLDYEIREAKPFSLGGTLYRFLVYGERS